MMNLTNHLLIATPDMSDERFAKAVILICEHNEHGALGINLNVISEVSFPEILSSLQIEANAEGLDQVVFEGGPVNTQCGFILHQDSSGFDSSIQVSKDIQLTTSKDIINAIARNQLNGQWLMALGCATWDEGQLESEIAHNAWLTCDSDQDIVFAERADKWNLALASLGIQAHQLSSDFGHA